MDGGRKQSRVMPLALTALGLAALTVATLTGGAFWASAVLVASWSGEAGSTVYAVAFAGAGLVWVGVFGMLCVWLARHVWSQISARD